VSLLFIVGYLGQRLSGACPNEAVENILSSRDSFTDCLQQTPDTKMTNPSSLRRPQALFRRARRNPRGWTRCASGTTEVGRLHARGVLP
jgi:hypothetical protein